MSSGVTVPVQFRVPSGRPEVPNGTQQRARVRPDERVPACLHGFHPFGFAPEGDARNAKKIRLFLYAPAVGENHLRIHQGREEVEVAERFHDAQVPGKRLAVRRLPQAGTSARMNWEEGETVRPGPPSGGT